MNWKSPELYDPAGSGGGKLTKESDCWSLGMVVFEVLSSKDPFHEFEESGFTLMMNVIIKGNLPGRPQGAEGVWFTDDVWGLLELCWSRNPANRPTAGVILEHFERISMALEPSFTSRSGDAGAGWL